MVWPICKPQLLTDFYRPQYIHVRAAAPTPALRSSENTPPRPLRSQFDSDSESGSDIGSDGETSYRTTPPLTRPTSPIGFLGDSDEDEDDWDARRIEYTGGTELSPCFARDDTERSSLDAEDEPLTIVTKKGKSVEDWNDHIPGTPGIERGPFDWDAVARSREASSSRGTGTTSADAQESLFADEDWDEDDAEDDVWPDEMDSVRRAMLTSLDRIR